jgi:hypothetical protein
VPMGKFLGIQSLSQGSLCESEAFAEKLTATHLVSIYNLLTHRMNDVINKLNEMSRRYDAIAMLAMKEDEFLKYFGAIYSEINNFYRATNFSDGRTSEKIIEKCYGLLKTALDHHIAKSEPANAKSVQLFDETCKLLILILWRDLRIGDREHEEFDAIEMDFRALRACGLREPYELEFFSRWDSNKIDEVALNYAANNIKHFSKFVYNVASSQPDNRGRLLKSPQREWINLYKVVKQLHTDYVIIGAQE